MVEFSLGCWFRWLRPVSNFPFLNRTYDAEDKMGRMVLWYGQQFRRKISFL